VKPGSSPSKCSAECCPSAAPEFSSRISKCHPERPEQRPELISNWCTELVAEYGPSATPSTDPVLVPAVS
jgi:hypothetical protein